MPDLNALLTVQQHDTTLTQLAHRRAHLPEHDRVVELEAQVQAIDARRLPLATNEAALTAKQNALETQISEVDGKISSADRSLFGGTVTATRELQALEADLVSLRKRHGDLEDAEIEILMEREPLDAEIAAIDSQRAELVAQHADAVAAEQAAALAVEASARDEVAARATAAALVDLALMTAYDAIRGKNKGIGAAKVEHGTCGSCRLKIASVELDRIRTLAADAMVKCEECGAILIR